MRRAKRDGRTAIVLRFQNVSALEDQLGHIRLFNVMGENWLRVLAEVWGS